MPAWKHVDAVIFDLDGVVTRTSRLHAQAWKALFDELLAQIAQERGEPFRPFELSKDYLRHVDGKPREAGIGDFLASRGLELPRGGPGDPPDARTVWALGERKNRLFHELLERRGVEVHPPAVEQLRLLRARGIKTALVSASRNAERVLQAAGMQALFDVVIDGNEAKRLKLPGKPAADTFLEAAKRLGTPPARAAVVEDALAGVEAAKRGGFGQIVALSAGGDPEPLRRAGADVVVPDLAHMSWRAP